MEINPMKTKLHKVLQYYELTLNSPNKDDDLVENSNNNNNNSGLSL